MMTDTADRILALRSIFADHSAWHSLNTEFLKLLEHRRAQILTGKFREARGIALIGASGSGKSTAVARLIRSTTGLKTDVTGEAQVEIVSLIVPSPTTLKSLGRTILEALGRPLLRERTADTIWALVRGFLRERQVLFLHLDEAQDIARHQTPKEMQAVINTLKSLMQNKEWPVSVILSGMPSLRDMLDHDVQLARRMTPVEMDRLCLIGDINNVNQMIRFYARKVGLALPERRAETELAARLIYAADREFGLTIEMAIDAIEVALRNESKQLSTTEFATAFAIRSGCIPGLNPFLAVEFDRLDVRKLLVREGLS